MIDFGNFCQPITGYSQILSNYDKPHPDSQIRKIKLASSKADAVRQKGEQIGSHDYICQTVAHHPPISEKDDRFKTVWQLEQEFLAKNRKNGLFSDEIEWVNAETGEILVFPRYAKIDTIARAFGLKQKHGIYDFRVFKLNNYFGDGEI